MWPRKINFWIFFLLLQSVLHWVQGVQYGPSLDYLISPVNGNRKEIHLDGFYPEYSITIPISNGSATTQVGKIHPQGEFSILAPEGFGIMVVVQSLRLRSKVDRSSESVIKCRDYLRFTSGQESSQVCGAASKYSKEGSPGTLLGPRMFLTSNSQLTVTLFVDTALESSDYGWHEPLTAEVIVTAFKQCPKNSFINKIKKLVGRSPWRSCSPSEDKVCIHSSTLCDGVFNCGVRGPLGHLGYDEESCGKLGKNAPPTSSPIRPEAPGPATTTPTSYIGVNQPYTPPNTGRVISPLHLILIFSVVVLLIFGACTWLAKANEKKFQHTVQRFSTMRRNRRNNQNRRRGRAVDEVMGDETLRRPSAPPVSTSNTLRGIEDIEGLEMSGEEPPAYDHLFPSAPPLTATSTLNNP